MRFVHALVLVCLGLSIPGCGGVAGSSVTVLTLDDVPPELLAAARKKLPGVAFDTVWRKASGTYEIRGKQKNGKIREVDIEPDGTITEVE